MYDYTLSQLAEKLGTSRKFIRNIIHFTPNRDFYKKFGDTTLYNYEEIVRAIQDGLKATEKRQP